MSFVLHTIVKSDGESFVYINLFLDCFHMLESGHTLHLRCREQSRFSFILNRESTGTSFPGNYAVSFPMSISASVVCSRETLFNTNSIGNHHSFCFLEMFLFVISA